MSLYEEVYDTLGRLEEMESGGVVDLIAPGASDAEISELMNWLSRRLGPTGMTLMVTGLAAGIELERYRTFYKNTKEAL